MAGLWPARRKNAFGRFARKRQCGRPPRERPAHRRRGTIGIGTIVLALVAMYFGVDPNVVLQMAEGPTAQQQQAPAQRPPADDPQARFVAKVLGETEDTWAAIFQNDLNRRYAPPKLVLFRGATPPPAAPASPPWGRSTVLATARCTSTWPSSTS